MMHDESSSMRHNNVMNVEQQRLQKCVLHNYRYNICSAQGLRKYVLKFFINILKFFINITEILLTNGLKTMPLPPADFEMVTLSSTIIDNYHLKPTRTSLPALNSMVLKTDFVNKWETCITAHHFTTYLLYSTLNYSMIGISIRWFKEATRRIQRR